MSLVGGDGLLTITGGGQIGHARGTQPECPDKLRFASQGNFNTLYGCRLAAVLFAVAVSLAAWVVAWLASLAKGTVAAAREAEILKVKETRTAQATA